jgi:hypothetical protein
MVGRPARQATHAPQGITAGIITDRPSQPHMEVARECPTDAALQLGGWLCTPFRFLALFVYAAEDKASKVSLAKKTTMPGMHEFPGRKNGGGGGSRNIQGY